MNRVLGQFILLGGLLLPLSVAAQDEQLKAGVNLSINQDQEIWAGQQLSVNLDLKTTGFSFSNSHFNLPEVSGAFLMQTDSTTIKLTERVDGQSWQVVRYPLALYPQKAGQLEIPPIDVRFVTSAGFGSEQTAFEFQTEPLSFEVMLPPGARPGDLIVSTRSFELEYDWQPSTAAAKTGDAVTLRVRRQAGDISAMLLPPLPVYRTEGLASYPQTPEIDDKTDRGDLTGVRTDSITWLVEEPGTYDIPGIRFQWWDPDRKELKQQIVPGLSLDIPSTAQQGAVVETAVIDAQNKSNLWSILFLSLTGLLAVILWLRFGPRINQPGTNSEKTAFTDLQQACKRNQASQAHAAMHSWIALIVSNCNIKSGPPTLAEFAGKSGDENLAGELRKLQEALITPGSDWRGDGLLAALKNTRQRFRHKDNDQPQNALSPLNP